jgi:hypothetical protein
MHAQRHAGHARTRFTNPPKAQPRRLNDKLSGQSSWNLLKLGLGQTDLARQLENLWPTGLTSEAIVCR